MQLDLILSRWTYETHTYPADLSFTPEKPARIMVRPNMDIRRDISGGVADIRDGFDTDDTEEARNRAYELVLELGLQELGHPGFACVQIPRDLHLSFEDAPAPQTTLYRDRSSAEADTPSDREDTTDHSDNNN